MYLFHIIFAFLFQLLATRTFAIPTVPVVDEYLTLSNLCNEGGEDTYVAVLYANGERITYKYGECYPYSIGESQAVQAEQAVFCKLSFCVGKSNIDCSGTTFPSKGLSVPVPPAATLVNPFRVVEVTGAAAVCDKLQSSLPGGVA